MEVIPAVDLLAGEAVRLVEGDFSTRAGRHADPFAAVTGWVRDGARRLHLVDLDGARTGRPGNLGTAFALVEAARAADSTVKVQLGGGLRDAAAVDGVLAAGVDVAILGTAAARGVNAIRAMVDRWPGRIGVSIDVRDGALAIDGWTRTIGSDPVALAAELSAAGVATIVVTDVRRDGTRRGPNLDLVRRVRAALPRTRLVAAGGIGSIDGLRDLAGAGADGAIVGLALLDGSLRLADALAAVAPGAPA